MVADFWLVHPTRYWRVADFCCGFLISAPYRILEGNGFLVSAPDRLLMGSGFFCNRRTVGFFFKIFFLEMLSGTDMIYLNYIVLLILLEKIDFLKLTM